MIGADRAEAAGQPEAQQGGGHRQQADQIEMEEPAIGPLCDDLAPDERAEARVYRDLAQNRSGEERAILLALAEAEGRHEAHWLQLLGENAGRPRPASLRSQFLGFLARHFGSVFVLALAQRAESRSPYANDPSATPAMVADEQIHEEVVRGLATRGADVPAALWADLRAAGLLDERAP